MSPMSRWAALVAGVLFIAVIVAVLTSGGGGGDGSGPAAVGYEPENLTVGTDIAPAEPGDLPSPAAVPTETERLALVEEQTEADRLALQRAGLLPGRKVSGRVVRASDGTPLEGVSVDPGVDRKPGQEWKLLPTFVLFDTNEEGLFAHESVDPRADFLRFRWGDRFQDVPIPTGGDDIKGVDVVFDSGWILHGRVLDPTGAPVPDAQVTLMTGSTVEEEGETSVKTSIALFVDADEEGVFIFRDILTSPEDGVVTVGAQAAWHSRSEEDFHVPGGPGRYGPVDLVLAPGGSLEGYVTDGAAPLARARVRVRGQMTTRHYDASDFELEARTDENGWYRIPSVPVGRLLVSGKVSDRRYEAWIPDVWVEPAVTTRLDMVLPPGAVVSGRVTDTSGNPVSGMALELRRSLSWDSPDAGGSMLSQMSGDEGPVEAVTRMGEDGVTRTRMTSREALTETNVRGEFRIEDVSPGEKDLVAARTQNDRLTPERHVFTVGGPGEFHPDMDFVVGAGLTIEGRVVDERGYPLPDVSIVVKPLGIAIWSTEDAVRTGEDGRFAVTGLPDEAMRLWAHKTGRKDVWKEARGGREPLDLVMQPAQMLKGAVYDAATREPVTDYGLTAKSGGSTMGMGVVDEEGVFSINADEEGAYELTIEATGYETWVQRDIDPQDTMITPLVIYLRRL